MYGKLIDGVLFEAPRTLTIENKVHYHPTKEMYIANGFLPVVYNSYPDSEETTYMCIYQEENSQIIQNWIEVNV